MQQGVDLSVAAVRALRCSLSQASSWHGTEIAPFQVAQDSWGAWIIKQFMAQAAPSLSSAQDGSGWNRMIRDGMKQHWDTGERWGLGIPFWKGWVPSGTPQTTVLQGNICILGYVVAKWPFWHAALIPFSPRILKWRKSNPKTKTSQRLWEHSLPLCCARIACRGW